MEGGADDLLRDPQPAEIFGVGDAMEIGGTAILDSRPHAATEGLVVAWRAEAGRGLFVDAPMSLSVIDGQGLRMSASFVVYTFPGLWEVGLYLDGRDTALNGAVTVIEPNAVVIRDLSRLQVGSMLPAFSMRIRKK